MKKIQIFRSLLQLSYITLLFTSFFIDFKSFLLVILISTVLGGAFFCGWLCPFGTLQEILGNISDLFNIKKIKISNNIHKYLRYMRYIILILALNGLIFLYRFDARISFLDILNGSTIAIIAYLSVGFFVLLSLFVDRPFCNYFCPQGAQYGLFSSLRLFRIKRNKDLCINCKICDSKCPMNIKISEGDDVKSLQCINCFECIANCPKKGALKYGFSDFRNLFKFKN